MKTKTAHARAILPARLNLIQDSHLSDQEIFFLRYLHQGYRNLTYCDENVILQHLWNAYGYIFSDRCLLYAALAYSCQFYYWKSPKSFQISSMALKLRDQTYSEFVSRFQRALMNAIQKDEITECHLFAIWLILYNSFYDRQFVATHIRGFLTVLRYISTYRQEPETAARGVRRLPYLHHLALSFIWVFEFEDALQVSDRLPLLWEIHQVKEEVSVPRTVPDVRATRGLPAQYWLQTRGDPLWWALMGNLRYEKISLFICFQRMCHPHYFGDDDHEARRRLVGSLASLKYRLEEIFCMLSVQKLLSCVHSHHRFKILIYRSTTLTKVLRFACVTIGWFAITAFKISSFIGFS